MPTASLAWMAYVLTLIGVAEVPGPGNNSIIAGWLKGLKAWWHDDATPWCGVLVAHCMQKAGQPLPKHWYRAKGWQDWGVPAPLAYGAVAILDREGGGHVFFITQVSPNFIWGIGGNQGDKVCEAKFPRSRLIGCRWPASLAGPKPLAMISDIAGLVSKGEA